jgi:hypothetical protein
MEETLEKLQNSSTKMEEAEKEYKDKEEDVNAQSRRVLLLEEEVSTNLREPHHFYPTRARVGSCLI